MIIAGANDYEFTVEDHIGLQHILDLHGISEVLVPGTSPLCECAAIWARLSAIPVRSFEPDWQADGAEAHTRRDARMLDHATAIALLPGSPALDGLHAEATRRGLKIFDFRHR